MLIVDPASSSAAAAKALAARPRSLEGVTIALLDNSKPNAGVLLERVGATRLSRALPLSFYRHLSFETMRNDSLDRFGTSIERRCRARARR